MQKKLLGLTLTLVLFQACLQQPTITTNDLTTTNNTSGYGINEFKSTQTNMEVISHAALKAKVTRVFELTATGSGTALDFLDEMKADFSDDSSFTSGKYKSLLILFDLACTEILGQTASKYDGISSSNEKAKLLWKELTGLELLDSDLSTYNDWFAQPNTTTNLFTPIHKDEFVCITLALQPPVWLKR